LNGTLRPESIYPSFVFSAPPRLRGEQDSQSAERAEASVVLGSSQAFLRASAVSNIRKAPNPRSLVSLPKLPPCLSASVLNKILKAPNLRSLSNFLIFHSQAFLRASAPPR
jgi:hypothetical protein